ncbi:MAG: hypothetical protein II987_04495 [Clostridia bacterium]|nr:hypothetical protein [Clostridia bacterium]
MKKLIAFFKQNSKLIVDFWVNQVVWSVVGLMVSWPMSIMLNKDPNYSLYMGLAAAFTAGIFWFRIYDMLNQHGLKYAIKRNKGSSEQLNIPSDSFGLKIGLFAYAPTILLVLIFAAFSIFNFESGRAIMAAVIYMIPIHSIYNAGWLALSDLGETVLVIFTVLTLIPIPCFAWLGYYLGVRDKGVIAREKVNKE